jgi:subtilase family serine protease
VLAIPASARAGKPVDAAEAYLRSSTSLVDGEGRLPIIDAAFAVDVMGEADERDVARYQLWLATPDNAEAAISRLLALHGTPWFDELATRSWLLALLEGEYGLGVGWTGADPIVLSRALQMVASRPIDLNFEDDGGVSSIYALLVPRLVGAAAAIQRADGGFGFADEPSDVVATAELALALAHPNIAPSAAAPLAAARTWLADAASKAGSLPAADLALLLLAGELTPGVADGLASALEARQWPDGSFDGDVRATALAIRALRGYLPNLSVERQATTPSQVAWGQSASVAVRVHNTSTRAALATSLDFSLLDASGTVVTSGTTPVPALLGQQSVTVAASFVAPATAGSYVLRFVANASMAFDESGYDDNVLALKLQVSEPPDLVLEPFDVTTIPSPPLLHETTRVTVRVRNAGGSPAPNVQVQLFDADPASGGTLLGETVLNEVAPGIPRSLDVSFTPRSMEPICLFARVDPANAIVETNETNNATALTVTPKAPADFQWDFSVYTLTPASGAKIAQGQPVTVEAVFHFEIWRYGQPVQIVRKSWPFTTVPVALYREATDGTWTLASKGDVDLLKPFAGDLTRAAYTYSFSLSNDAPAGVYRYRFVVDPDATRPDLQPSDNWITTQFEITNPGVAELLFEFGSVKADPPIVDAAHPTVVRGRVGNIGSVTALNVPVEFKAPNRTFTTVIPSLAPGEWKEVAGDVTFGDVSGRVDVVLTIDPASTIPESTKSNNSATATLWPSSCAIAFKSVAPILDPSPGGTMTSLRIEAQNVGYVPIEGFTARALLDGVGSVGETIFRPTVAVGDSVVVEFPISLLQVMSGDKRVTVELDPWSTSPPQHGPSVSSDIVVRVRRPDLTVAGRGIALDRQVGPAGEELVVPTITVDNLGGLPAKTSLRIYRGYPSAGDLVEAGTLEVSTGGAAVYAGAPFAPPTGPPFVISVSLDEENVIPELDESNNVATRPVEKNLGDVVVAFDETHGPGSTVGLNPGAIIGSFAGDHTDWVRDLEAHGYVVTTLNPDTDGFTPAKLRGVDVLVGPTSERPLTPDEQQLLKEFVQRGGGYFLMGEWGSTTYDPKWWEWEKGVASIFGLVPVQELVGRQVPCGGYCQNFMRSDGGVLQHPVTDGVDIVFGAMPGGFSALPPGATVLAKSGPYPWTPTDTAVMGVLEFGAGRVGFTGEGTMADASIADCGSMAGCGIASPYYTRDNRRFLRQMIDWLANGGAGDFPADLAISPATVKLSNSSPIATESVRVSVVVRNIGGATTTLGPTLVRFYDGPGSSGAVLAEVPVPDLKVDQGFEAFFDWDTTHAAGLHQITAVVDPDGLLAERLETNNEATVEVRVRARHDLRIDPSDISIAPGTPPIATVRVHNVGYAPVPAGVPLRLKLVEGATQRQLGELALPEVPARGAATMTMVWPGDYPTGAFELTAEVDADHALIDAVPGDGVASIEHAPPALAVSAPQSQVVWGGVKTVRWTARSVLRPRLAEFIAIAPAGGPFTGLGSVPGSYALDTTKYPDGPYVLRVTADDGLQRTTREIPFTIANTGLAVRTFGSAGSWTSSGAIGSTSVRMPVGSRVTSATALVDVEGSPGIKMGDGMSANLRVARIVRFRGRLHFIAVQEEVLRDWISEDDGATWAAPVALTPPGARVQWGFAAANRFAIHVAYQVLESTPHLFLMSTGDGNTWSDAADWGRGPSSDISLTATEEGIAATTVYGAGNLYIATADAHGGSRSPTAYVHLDDFSGPVMGVVAGGRVRIAHGLASSYTNLEPALAYTEVPLERYADPAAYSVPVRLGAPPNSATLAVVGDQLDLAYTVGPSQFYQRCTIGDECTVRERWLPEPATLSWDKIVLAIPIVHGASGSTTSSAWPYGGSWYAAQSIRFGRQWGEWFETTAPLTLGYSGSILHEPGTLCAAGNVLGQFNFVCTPKRTPAEQRVDVGGDGSIELARSGGTDAGTTSTAFAASLNAWLASHADGDDGTVDGQVDVPLQVTSIGAGQTVLRNLEVRYVPESALVALAEPEVFSPGGSPGVRDTSALSMKAAGAIEVRSAAGEVVRSLTPVPVGARYAAVFDGRTNAGTLLPSGRYPFGPPGAPNAEVEIDDIAPTVQLDAVSGPLGVRVPIRGVATDSDWAGTPRNFTGYRLERSAGGGAWTPVASGTSPVSGVIAELNAAGIPAGPITLRLTAWDVAGNTSSTMRTVSVDPTAPAPPLITSPTVAGSPVDVTSPHVNVGGAAEPGTQVRVYSAGSLVGEVPCDGNWVLAGLELPPGVSVVTARTVRNGIESADAAPIEIGLYALQVSVATPAEVDRSGEGAATVSVARTSAVGGPLTLLMTVTDFQGDAIPLGLSPAEQVVVPANGAPASFQVQMSAGGAAPGTYQLHATVMSGAPIPATAASAFAITAADVVAAHLTSDRATYGDMDPVELSTTVTNDLSAGEALGLVATITVSEPGGTETSFAPMEVGDLLPGEQRVRTTLLTGGPRPTGTYVASVLIVDQFGAVRASATTSFQVAKTSSGVALSGSLSVVPGEYTPGVPVLAEYFVENAGVQLDVDLSVLLVEEASGTLVFRVDGHQQVASGGGWGGTAELATSDGLGDLVAILVANGRTLAVQPVPLSVWTDTSPPLIDVDGVAEGEYRSGDVVPVITITDASPVVSSATMDQAPFASGTTVSAEGDHVLTVEATDSWGNTSTAVVHFTIDITPPEISVTGVADGETRDAPVSPAFAATDEHLAGPATATLDGASFASGTPVDALGLHKLVVTATDLAGNVGILTLTFTITAPGAPPALSAQTDPGPRLLVGLACSHPEPAVATPPADCGCDDAGAACCGVPAPFLFATLHAASIPHETSAGGDALLRRFRTHLHDVRILYRYSPGEAPSLEELREATWAGGGLVLVLAGAPDADPGLADAGGVRSRGVVKIDGDAQVSAGPLGPARSLALAGTATSLRLEGGEAVVQTPSGAVIVATHGYGRGRVVTISFDPEENTTPEVADLLVRAIDWAGSADTASPVAGVPFFASLGVTQPAGAAADLRLVALPPAGLGVLAAPLASKLDPPTWFFHLEPGEAIWRSLILETPSTPVSPVEVSLAEATGGDWLDVATTSLSVPSAPDLEPLRSCAVARLTALDVGAHDRERKAYALDAVQGVPADPMTQEEAGEAIQAVVRAVDRLRAVETADVDSAREALDALLRALELRSLTAVERSHVHED